MAESENNILAPDTPEPQPDDTSNEWSIYSSSGEAVASKSATQTLEVKNVDRNITTEQLVSYFSTYGECDVDRKGPMAWIMFRDSVSATDALDADHNPVLGDEVEVRFVRDYFLSDTVYLSNIDECTDPVDLRAYLSRFGHIVAIDVNKNKASVRFADSNAAFACFDKLYDDKFKRNNYQVSLSR